MFKLIDFLIHGCWHKWTIKDEFAVWDAEKPKSTRAIGTQYVLQCEKCGRISHYNTWA
jgi:hypothetical protein